MLCRNHHKQVDDQEKEYTVEKLIEIKRQHEMWVAQSLSGEQKLRQRNLEVYADYIDKWRQYFLVDEWKRWTSFLLQPTPLFYKKDFESIKKGKEWLFTRIWSSEIPQLEDCFKNFFRISRDLMIVFGEFVDSETLEDSLRVKPFYETGNFTQQEYDELLNKFEFHVDFIFDLVAELTRAANLVSDMIRAHIDPSFMLEGGRLVIQQGLNMNLQYVSHIPLYEKEDLENLYIGIKSFSDARFDRDFYRGLQKHRNFSELSYVAMDKND